MLTLSDSAATDTLLRRVGLERVNALTRSLGLERTRIAGDVRFMCDRLAADAGFACWEELAAYEGPDEAAVLDRMRASREADPAHATRTTPREATRLLALIWRDEAAPPEACAEVRTRMAQQLTRHRIARGLPPHASFAGKTGSFAGAFRNEVGVTTLPDGRRLALAVFTRAHRPYERGREIDDAIGEAAALCVAALSPK
jgi:beta-lactamase class A